MYVSAEGQTSYKDMPLNMRKLLSILGIDENNITPVTDITRFKKIIVPDESFYNDKDETRFLQKNIRIQLIKSANIRKKSLLRMRLIKSVFHIFKIQFRQAGR